MSSLNLTPAVRCTPRLTACAPVTHSAATNFYCTPLLYMYMNDLRNAAIKPNDDELEVNYNWPNLHPGSPDTPNILPPPLKHDSSLPLFHFHQSKSVTDVLNQQCYLCIDCAHPSPPNSAHLTPIRGETFSLGSLPDVVSSQEQQ